MISFVPVARESSRLFVCGIFNPTKTENACIFALLKIRIFMEQLIYFIGVVWQELCDSMLCPHDGTQYAIAPLIVAGALSAAASLANGIFGASSAAKQKREQEAAIQKQKAEERAFFQRRYNEDATQRADAQRLLTRANEMNKKRTQAAMGRKAVVGGTDASVEAMKQANAAQVSNAVSDIAARADAKKDALEDAHRSRMSNLDAQETAIRASAEAAKRNATAQAATGLVNTAASVIAASGDMKAKAPKYDASKQPNISNEQIKSVGRTTLDPKSLYEYKKKDLTQGGWLLGGE